MKPVKIDCEPQINNKAERTTDPHVISGVMNLALKTSKLQIVCQYKKHNETCYKKYKCWMKISYKIFFFYSPEKLFY